MCISFACALTLCSRAVTQAALPAIAALVGGVVGAVNQILRTRADAYDLAESINYDDSLLDT
jgi:hypothetical protein